MYNITAGLGCSRAPQPTRILLPRFWRRDLRKETWQKDMRLLWALCARNVASLLIDHVMVKHLVLEEKDSS